MNPIIKVVLMSATLFFAGHALAEDEGVEHAMKQMNKSYRAAL